MAILVACWLLACTPDGIPGGSGPVGGDPADAASGVTPDTTYDPAFPEEPGEPTPHMRGLWVLAEGSYRVLDDPARIEPLLERARTLGVSDLFVQVYRGGRVFYPTSHPIESALATADGAPPAPEADALRQLLDAAHERDLRVHAWVNVLSLSTRRQARLIEELGPSAILVDRLGRSILDYPELDLPEPDRRFYRMGTRGVYLDPALPRVRERLVAVFHDLVTRYPELDGLHLDYIRHPGVLPFSPGSRFGVGLEFGYGAETRALYTAETGHPDPIEGADPGTVRAANQWDAWRRDQVTTLVDEISATARAAHPELVISAAVIPYVDRAYLSLAQDWRRWLESGAIDRAIPMVYTLDDRLFRYQVETFAGWPGADRIWAGVGVWLFANHPERAHRQLEILRATGLSGEVLFSDDALSEAPELVAALAAPAPTPQQSIPDPEPASPAIEGAPSP